MTIEEIIKQLDNGWHLSQPDVKIGLAKIAKYQKELRKRLIVKK